MKRWWILVGICCLWLRGFGAPNYILILTDDHGWTSTSVGMDAANPLSRSDYHETPSLERLAGKGMRFSQGYAPAAICTPTRRSILFGESLLRMGPDEGFAERYDPKQGGYTTIPLALKTVDADYRAAHFGKWHIKSEPYSPEDYGFDESDGNTSNDDGNRHEYAEDKWKNVYLTEAPKRVGRITERGISFMRRSVESGAPFYLQLSHYATHVDIQTRPETYTHFANKARGRVHDHPGYAGMLSDLDTAIGEILDAVEELGIADNTYIVMMADNGGVEFIPPTRNKLAKAGENGRLQRNDPLRGGKWVLYEGGIRVPFLIAGPGIAAGSQCDVPVIGYDLLPTFVSLAGGGVSLPTTLDGGDLSHLLTGGTDQVERFLDGLVFHRYAPGYLHSAIRQGDYKLVRFWKKNLARPAGEELYDLGTDLSEAEDLSDHLPAKTRELKELLDEYIQTVDANIEG
jgi:arylsulfatase A